VQDPVPEFIQILAPREELLRAAPLPPTRTQKDPKHRHLDLKTLKISFLQISDQLFADQKNIKKTVFSDASQKLKNRARGRPRAQF
jgi:hypothetical protein